MFHCNTSQKNCCNIYYFYLIRFWEDIQFLNQSMKGRSMGILCIYYSRIIWFWRDIDLLFVNIKRFMAFYSLSLSPSIVNHDLIVIAGHFEAFNWGAINNSLLYYRYWVILLIRVTDPKWCYISAKIYMLYFWIIQIRSASPLVSKIIKSIIQYVILCKFVL